MISLHNKAEFSTQNGIITIGRYTKSRHQGTELPRNGKRVGNGQNISIRTSRYFVRASQSRSSNRSKKPICGFSTRKNSQPASGASLSDEALPGSGAAPGLWKQKPQQKDLAFFALKISKKAAIGPPLDPLGKAFDVTPLFCCSGRMINMVSYAVICCENRIAVEDRKWLLDRYLTACPPATAVLYPAVLRRSNKELGGAEWVFGMKL